MTSPPSGVYWLGNCLRPAISIFWGFQDLRAEATRASGLSLSGTAILRRVASSKALLFASWRACGLMSAFSQRAELERLSPRWAFTMMSL